MKRILYTFSLGLAAFAVLALPASAQEKRSGKLGEYDEIVIKRKGASKDAKVTVEIKDGEVWVDGKKLDEFKNGNIIVQRRAIVPRDGNMPQRGGMQLFDEQEEDLNIDAPAAVLGVMTKKETAEGATVVEVAGGTPADKAGLKAGDVITKVNDKKIAEPQDLFETIGSMKPGDKVTVTYLRDKKEMKANATLDKRPAQAPRSFRFDPDGDVLNQFRFRMPPNSGGSPFGNVFEERGPSLGLAVQDTEEGNGARVTNVRPGSSAEKSGFKTGDLVTEMAGKAVKNARDVAEAYRENREDGSMNAKIKRDGKEQTLSIKVVKPLRTENL